MNLVSVRIITDDIHRLVGFYERATGVEATWLAPDVFAELATANGTLAIGHSSTVPLFGEGCAQAGANRSSIVEFLVDDVDASYAALRGWVGDVVGEPKTMPWGNRSLLFRDPDGNLVNFFTPATEQAVARFAAVAR